MLVPVMEMPPGVLQPSLLEDSSLRAGTTRGALGSTVGDAHHLEQQASSEPYLTGHLGRQRSGEG